jgi:outer membrane protein assembly factor BamD (BamD/ComL family)
MRNKTWIASLLFCVALFAAPAVYAQGGVKAGPDPSTIRDPELEKDSLHNYEVAKNYFKLKKAYVAALVRLEEIIAGNPNFAKIEEVYLMAGQSSLWLADGKGKQKSDQYYTMEGGVKHTLTADQLRQLGRDYLSRLVNDYPESPYSKQAAEELKAVGGPLPKPSNP